MTKGADSHITPRLKKGQEALLAYSEGCIHEFAEDGLRTLYLAQRVIPEHVYQEWAQKYQDAMTSMTDRQDKIDQCSEMVEIDLELVGSTAIEDKL